MIQYVTATELGRLLQVSPKTVYRWAAQDPTFPALKINGTVRFPLERVEKWLRGKEQGPGRVVTNNQLLTKPQVRAVKGIRS